MGDLFAPVPTLKQRLLRFSRDRLTLNPAVAAGPIAFGLFDSSCIAGVLCRAAIGAISYMAEAIGGHMIKAQFNH